MQAVVTLLEYNVASKLAETLAAAIVRRVDPLNDLMETLCQVLQDMAADTRNAVMVI